MTERSKTIGIIALVFIIEGLKFYFSYSGHPAASVGYITGTALGILGLSFLIALMVRFFVKSKKENSMFWSGFQSVYRKTVIGVEIFLLLPILIELGTIF